jgi:putative endonuclease
VRGIATPDEERRARNDRRSEGLACNDRDSMQGKPTMKERQYYVYIMTNVRHTVLYTGVTNDLLRRVNEHKAGKGVFFSSKYRTSKLIWYECGGDVNTAIFREKQIKAGSREKKIVLINQLNPSWEDLAERFYDEMVE